MFRLGEHSFKKEYITEELGWIPHNCRFHDEPLYKYNRSFVSSFGLKSDSVGWCSLEGNIDPELVKSIFDKAKEEKINIRGSYRIKLSSEFESDWYIFEPPSVSAGSDAIGWDYNHRDYDLKEVKAFALPSSLPIIGYAGLPLFRKDVADYLKEAYSTDLETFWARDTGKYRGHHYFQIEVMNTIPRIFTEGRYIDKQVKSFSAKIADYGQNAYQIAKRSSIEISLPFEVNRKLLENKNFAVFNFSMPYRLLFVSKEVRNKLTQKGFAKKEHFEPLILTDRTAAAPHPYLVVTEGSSIKPVPQEIKTALSEEYEKYQKKVKPKRIISESIALKKLRETKRLNSQYFSKRLSKSKLPLVPDEGLLPYLNIADGGALSDEYSYFSAAEMAEETAELDRLKLQEETLLPDRTLVIGKAADGELIILLPDGKVVRYQFGEIDYAASWDNLPCFFYEACESD